MNFPDLPTNGQVFGLYTYDGEKWVFTSGPGGITQADADLRYVNIPGDTMTGPLALPAVARAVNIGAPSASNAALGVQFNPASWSGVEISCLSAATAGNILSVFNNGYAGTWSWAWAPSQAAINVSGPWKYTDATASTSPTTGALTVAGGVGIAGQLNAGNNIAVSLGAYVAGDIYVGYTSPSGVIRFGNAGSGANYLYWDGSAFSLNGGSVKVNAATASTSPTTGALTVAGGVGVGGGLYVGGPGGAAPAMTSVDTRGGGASIAVAANFGGLGIPGVYSVGAFPLWLGANSTPQISVSTAGNVAIAASTASTSPTTGALTVAGGVGVGGTIYAGGALSVTGGGAAIGGSTIIAGDITAYRAGGTTGYHFFNSGNTKYLGYNGTNFEFVGGNIDGGTGYRCRQGVPGGYSTDYFNFFYNAGPVQLWMNGGNLGNITVTSDYRIKKDVIDLPGMWDTVKALRPIKYTQAAFTPPSQVEYLAAQKAEGKEVAERPMFPADNIERWGFIAHELQQTLTPSAAAGEKDSYDTVQSLNLPVLIAALTKALQEAMARIEALEAAP
jgi:prepilin-type processing-associated H-X9-DG protein